MEPPPSSSSPSGRTIRVVAAVIERDGQYLITQRRTSAVLPLMWEFPGGRVEAGETDQQALKREVLHRLGVEIEVGKLISFVSHPYEHYVVDLFLYECTLAAGSATSPRAARGQRVQVGHERRVRSVPVHARRRGAHEQAPRRFLRQRSGSGSGLPRRCRRRARRRRSRRRAPGRSAARGRGARAASRGRPRASPCRPPHRSRRRR